MHCADTAEAIEREAYLEIRREDERFGQEIGRIYRELPEAERAAAFEAICVPYSEKMHNLYRQLFGIQEV